MTDFRRLLGPDLGEDAISIRLVGTAGFDAFHASLSEVGRAAVSAAGFKGRADTALFLPEGNGRDWSLLAGLGDATEASRWTLAAAAAIAPEGRYRLAAPVPALALHGWLMAQHRFARYRKADDARGPR